MRARACWRAGRAGARVGTGRGGPPGPGVRGRRPRLPWRPGLAGGARVRPPGRVDPGGRRWLWRPRWAPGRGATRRGAAWPSPARGGRCGRRARRRRAALLLVPVVEVAVQVAEVEPCDLGPGLGLAVRRA